MDKYKFNEIPLNDKKTWDLICTGKTKGIFQVESQLGQDLSKRIQPRDINGLSDVVALMRPGPLESGLTDQYIKHKFGEEKIEYISDALKPILDKTQGVLTYQEQMIEIVTVIAGFSEEQADNARKAVGKKKPEEMSKLKSEFIDGCEKVGLVDSSTANEIFNWIEKGQRYIFNKCVSKDTIIKRPITGGRIKADGYTVEHMFKIKNDIEYAKQCGQISLYKKFKLNGHYGQALSLDQDGRIRTNTILDIYDSGYKDVYLVTTESGKSIKTAKEHKFPTPEGEKQLQEISVGSLIYVQMPYEKTDFAKKYRLSGKEQNCKGIRYSNNRPGFPEGQDNPAYVNGGWVKFTKYKKETPDKCANCGADDKNRYEIHHIDGNRTNNEYDNLEKLCVSCHKKKDYLLGRTKQFQKGYPSKTEKIVSIEHVGIEHVYDVEMAGPNHNFVTGDGIVTSNSHSVSYAMLSYQTAYAKANYPLQFYTAYLNHSGEKQNPKQEIFELIQDAKRRDIVVKQPDVFEGNADFIINKDNEIVYGLSHIRNVGQAAIKVINKVVKGTKSFEDVILYGKQIKRNVLESLIKSGAFDKFGNTRMQMLKTCHIILGQNGDEVEDRFKPLTNKEYSQFLLYLKQNGEIKVALQKVLDNNDCVKSRRSIIEEKISLLDHKFKDTNRQNAIWEKIYLGMSISCSAADDIPKVYGNVVDCKDIDEILPGNKIALHVVIEQVRRNQTKKGHSYCYLEVSDNTCSLSGVVCWPQQFKKYKKELVQGNVIEILVKKDCFRGRDQVVIENILSLG